MKLIIDIDEQTYNKARRYITELEIKDILTVRKAIRKGVKLETELEEIKAEIGKQYDRVEKDNLYCAEGLEMAYNILDNHINKADCDNDCEHCTWTECPKE